MYSSRLIVHIVPPSRAFLRLNCIYIGGIIDLTCSGSTPFFDEALHQRSKLDEVRDSQQRPTLADGDLWIRCHDVGPLPRH